MKQLTTAFSVHFWFKPNDKISEKIDSIIQDQIKNEIWTVSVSGYDIPHSIENKIKYTRFNIQDNI